MISMLALIGLVHSVSPPPVIMLDGGSMYPPKQRVTYEWWCPDGLVRIAVAQVHGSYPTIRGASYGETSVGQRARQRIDDAIKPLRTVQSISPRCLTAGGISLLFDGLLRNQVPSKLHVVSVEISPRGQVTVEP